MKNLSRLPVGNRNIVRPYCHIKDQRGELLGLINSKAWKEINLIRTNSGEVRGNHYHKHTLEFIFLLKGKVKIDLAYSDTHERFCTFFLNENEGIMIRPNILHTFCYQEESEQISFLDCAFDPSSPDMHVGDINTNFVNKMEGIDDVEKS